MLSFEFPREKLDPRYLEFGIWDVNHVMSTKVKKICTHQSERDLYSFINLYHGSHFQPVLVEIVVARYIQTSLPSYILC